MNKEIDEKHELERSKFLIEIVIDSRYISLRKTLSYQEALVMYFKLGYYKKRSLINKEIANILDIPEKIIEELLNTSLKKLNINFKYNCKGKENADIIGRR